MQFMFVKLNAPSSSVNGLRCLMGMGERRRSFYRWSLCICAYIAFHCRWLGGQTGLMLLTDR